MTRKIVYNKGELLGPFNTEFIQDVESTTKTRKAKFKCSFCGKHFIAAVSKIKNGSTKSCGCQKKGINTKYQIGDKIGSCLLLERISMAPDYLVRCECSNDNCYNDFIVPLSRVLNKDRKYCDKCSQKFHSSFGQRQANSEKRKQASRKSIKTVFIGDKFGKLTVIQELEKRENNKRFVACKCDCGTPYFEVKAALLSNGHVTSCGCIKSLGEQKVANLLKELKINFIQEYTFSDCISSKGYPLKFDFYLPDYNVCIEYDGEQHFKDTSGWFKNSNFVELQKRDQIKNNFCSQNNIKLIRIPYTDFDKIDSEYICKNLILKL